ncbi:pseudouridine synthase [Caulobacter mirabilis]|uniref:Pseudouridine synthase n=1 Tax=Caulobacter mirabilis TaxID=69666 RepID=A0A2D2ASF4_9CAUL|nr:16S rRNA pseudouridine(516) synthase [Caulobacter mirabilis]
MSKTPTIRLDRLLANMGYGSRKEMQALARHGHVLIDGEHVRDAEQRIALTPDLQQRLQIDRKPIDPLPGFCLMLHKPLGVTCSHKESGPLVYDLLPTRWRARDPAISTIGRLDKETSGLLLMTDDGALLHKVISPKHHVAKRYRVTLDRPLRGDEAATFEAGGLMLEGETKPLLPATMEILSPTETFLTLTEGRYHQVRRMFAAMGNHVVALHRDRMGGLVLPDDLPAGDFRILGDEDLKAIFAA